MLSQLAGRAALQRREQMTQSRYITPSLSVGVLSAGEEDVAQGGSVSRLMGSDGLCHNLK